MGTGWAVGAALARAWGLEERRGKDTTYAKKSVFRPSERRCIWRTESLSQLLDCGHVVTFFTVNHLGSCAPALKFVYVLFDWPMYSPKGVRLSTAPHARSHPATRTRDASARSVHAHTRTVRGGCVRWLPEGMAAAQTFQDGVRGRQVGLTARRNTAFTQWGNN